jgi:D-3-phosphoglycerate dehydrogenase
VSFDELLARSDYVSVHIPLTDETLHMFNEAAFRRMKPTAYLINTARGPIVESGALVEALQSGLIAGAGIDVYEREPPPADSPLLALENVVLSSHSAYYSDPALHALAVRCGQEVARVLTGRMPLYLVNPEVLGRLPLAAS